MTRRPTRFARYVWPIPITLVTMGITIMRPTSRYSSGRLGHAPAEHWPGGFPKSALSKISLISSGFAIPRTEVAMMAAETTSTFPR